MRTPFNLPPGERVIIQLYTQEIFEGDISKCGEDFIQIRNISEHNRNVSLTNLVMTFYRSEIFSVHLYNLSNLKKEDLNKDLNTVKYLRIYKCEFDKLRNMYQNYVYLSAINDRYYKALDHLSNCETLGIATFGNKVCRFTPIRLLAIATCDKVYLFDLHLIRCHPFPKDLKFIFITEDIKKVIHDSRPLVDCLHHFYQSKINNVFDTQFADKSIQEKKNPEMVQYRNIGECLSHYFNFPTNFLKLAMEAEAGEWKQRPLSDTNKLNVAQLATYLIILKTHLEEILLEDYYNRVTKYISIYSAKNKPNKIWLHRCKSNKI